MAVTTTKFINTSSEKLPDLPIVKGQIIFVKDERTIYVDTDTDVRTPFRQIFELDTELSRTSLSIPLKGFYFIKETSVLWRYDNGWTAITVSPKQQIVFDLRANFPDVGDPNTLYIDGLQMYRYLGKYVPIATGSSQWQELN